MEQAIAKAKALIEAMEYIRRFHGRIVVVKLGGSILDDMDLQIKLLTDIAFMATVGIQPIIVHGGGKAITKAMKEASLESVWIQGHRYTDERTLNIVEHTLVNNVNANLCKTLGELGCKAMGLHSISSCVLTAQQMHLTADDGRKLDLGFVGTVKEINDQMLKTLCDAGTIPVIAPVACDKTGQKMNINADSVAGKVAAAVKAEKLVSVSDTHGIRTNPDDPDSYMSNADEGQIKNMLASGVISAGMMPKVDACITALDGGVKKTHIIDGRIQHSLLLEIYTDKGIGTQIIK